MTASRKCELSNSELQGITRNIEDDVNSNQDLQSLFSDQDPDLISEKLLRGLNSIIKKHVKIKRIQLTKNNCPYWNNQLEEAGMTGSIDDDRLAKHKRNKHSRLIRSTAKSFYQQKFKVRNREFSQLKDLTETESICPTTIIKDGKTENKPEEIANIMNNFFIDKVNTIRSNIKADTFQAINTYKSIIPRVEKKPLFKKKDSI